MSNHSLKTINLSVTPVCDDSEQCLANFKVFSNGRTPLKYLFECKRVSFFILLVQSYLSNHHSFHWYKIECYSTENVGIVLRVMSVWMNWELAATVAISGDMVKINFTPPSKPADIRYGLPSFLHSLSFSSLPPLKSLSSWSVCYLLKCLRVISTSSLVLFSP